MINIKHRYIILISITNKYVTVRNINVYTYSKVYEVVMYF